MLSWCTRVRNPEGKTVMNPRNGFNPFVFAALIAACAIPVVAAQAQFPRPALQLEGNLLPGATIQEPPLPELARDASKVQIALGTAVFTYPIVSDQGRTMLFLEGMWRERHFAFCKWPAGISRELDGLREASAAVLLRRAVDDRWAVLLRLAPQISSNLPLNRVTGSDLDIQGAALIERAFGEHGSLGCGVAYTGVAGRPNPLPLVTFRYESGGRWHAGGYLPAAIEGWFRLSGAEIGLTARTEGGQYRIRRIFPASSGIAYPQLEYVAVSVTPAVRARIHRCVEATVAAGYVWQFVRILDDGESVGGGNYDLEAGAILRAGLDIDF